MVLDEPTNDLDMETLDLLEDVLSDYEGTLILVSHDRDFIDRLATSTIALNGRGDVVETPGGWSDFQTQNPGFLEPPETSGRRGKSAKQAAATAKKPAKLSFKDEHRLSTLEAHLPKLASEITVLERKLEDPNFFRRDAAGFERTMKGLQRARQDLAAAEAEWLEIETRREALAAS